MIAKLSGSQAKPCARLTASVASSSVQNGAVMCNRPGSLGSGCQLGGVAVQVAGGRWPSCGSCAESSPVAVSSRAGSMGRRLAAGIERPAVSSAGLPSR